MSVLIFALTSPNKEAETIHTWENPSLSSSFGTILRKKEGRKDRICCLDNHKKRRRGIIIITKLLHGFLKSSSSTILFKCMINFCSKRVIKKTLINKADVCKIFTLTLNANSLTLSSTSKLLFEHYLTSFYTRILFNRYCLWMLTFVNERVWKPPYKYILDG